MASIHELYGKACEQLEQEKAALAETMNLLRDLKNGLVKLQEVEVDPDPSGRLVWTVILGRLLPPLPILKVPDNSTVGIRGQSVPQESVLRLQTEMESLKTPATPPAPAPAYDAPGCVK